jgi:hypothetical protein
MIVSTTAVTAPDVAWDVKASGEVTGDGRIEKLVAYKKCETQGCMSEVRIGPSPNQTIAKSCSILNTRSAGHP